MINKDKFIERIKILVQGRSAKAVAEKIGCDPKTIRNALAGKIPGVEILDKLVAGEATVGWLLGETDIKDSNPEKSEKILDIRTKYDILGQDIAEWAKMKSEASGVLDYIELVKAAIIAQHSDFEEFLKKRARGREGHSGPIEVEDRQSEVNR